MRTGEESSDEPGREFGEGVDGVADPSTDSGEESSETEEPTDSFDPTETDPTEIDPTSETDPSSDPVDPTSDPFDPTGDPIGSDDSGDLSDQEAEEVLVDMFDEVAPGQGEEIVEDLESSLGMEAGEILDIVVGDYSDTYGEGDPTLPGSETDETTETDESYEDPTDSDDWFDDVDTDVEDPTGGLEPEDDLSVADDYGVDDALSVADMGEATEDLFDLS